MIKTLNALAEPNRLHIMELLQDRPLSVNEIVDKLSLHQPQVSKHLKVLVEAGLVEIERDAQRRIYKVRPEPLQELDTWLEPFRRNLEERFDRLDEYLQELQVKAKKEDQKS